MKASSLWNDNADRDSAREEGCVAQEIANFAANAWAQVWTTFL